MSTHLHAHVGNQDLDSVAICVSAQLVIACSVLGNWPSSGDKLMVCLVSTQHVTWVKREKI